MNRFFSIKIRRFAARLNRWAFWLESRRQRQQMDKFQAYMKAGGVLVGKSLLQKPVDCSKMTLSPEPQTTTIQRLGLKEPPTCGQQTTNEETK